MDNKRKIPKWIRTIVLLLFAGLIYAVYFTELGKPLSSERDEQITIYDQAAAPTIFVETSQAPTVDLNWAYATRDLLKIEIGIHGLETDVNLIDIICNPYIRIKEPVRHRLSGYVIGSVYDADGKAIQATYDYEISADGYSSLTIDLDLTIGPCADYLNFQETNVTPSTLPDLIGNYHLSFQVPVK